MISLWTFFFAAAPYCVDAYVPHECQRAMANIAVLEQAYRPGRSLDAYLEIAAEEAPADLWP